MIKRDESYWTRKVMAYLAENHRSWLCYKLADHFTSGIPDITVVAHDKTTWLELKCLKVGENMLERVKKDPLQFHDMCKIEDNGGACWYLIFMPGEDMKFVIVSPGFLRHSMSVNHAMLPQVYSDLSALTNRIRGED